MTEIWLVQVTLTSRVLSIMPPQSTATQILEFEQFTPSRPLFMSAGQPLDTDATPIPRRVRHNTCSSHSPSKLGAYGAQLFHTRLLRPLGTVSGRGD